ncbi:MAG: hypothetical protein KDA22_06050 [Phycisphaerales bacterium]|nr:hypothetical protein [Phycisphaerales bacterium]
MADRVREATRGRRLRRGVTLFEVLVAMAVLIALGALALPNLADMLDRRKLDNQVDEVVGQMMLARAKAQSDGSMVELVFLPRAGRMVVRGIGRPSDAPRSSSGTTTNSQAIAEPWADKPVDPSITVAVGSFSATAAEEADDFDSSGPLGDRTATSDPSRGGAGTPIAFGDRPADRFVQDDGEDDDAPTRVAVFAGDGSAVFAGCCRLTDERGRVVLIAVNPWTGLPAIDRGDGSATHASSHAADGSALPSADRNEGTRGAAAPAAAGTGAAKGGTTQDDNATSSAAPSFEFDDWP